MNSPQQSPLFPRCIAAIAAAILPFALVACVPNLPTGGETPGGNIPGETVSPPENPAPDQNQPPQQTASGVAELMMAGESFTFTPAVCIISENDVVIHGPGVGNESGEPAYLDIDIVNIDDVLAGGVRVNLGATGQFQSTDDFYSYDFAFDNNYGMTYGGHNFFFEANFYAGGEENLGPGTLTVSCSS